MVTKKNPRERFKGHRSRQKAPGRDPSKREGETTDVAQVGGKIATVSIGLGLVEDGWAQQAPMSWSEGEGWDQVLDWGTGDRLGLRQGSQVGFR